MAVKLTPGVFVVHFLVTSRWKEAATAVGTAVAVTVGMWVLLPQASFAFWGGALQDPARLGPNMGTSNQSIRGFLLRVGPDGMPGTVIWLGCVAAVGVFGFWLARRLYLAGDSIGEVAAVGLMACLLSPVAWIHHFHWIVVVVFALLGADPLRDRRRLWAGLGVTAFFLCRLPWWGISWLNHRDWPEFPGRVLQNADVFGALGALALLWWVTRPRPARSRVAGRRRRPGADAQSTPAISSRGVGGEQQADAAADPAEGRQPHPGEQGAAQRRRQPGHGGQGEERADEHRQRVVVAHDERGGEDLRQVAPLGEEQHGEAQRDDPPADDLAGRLRAELRLGLGLLLVGLAGAAQQQDAADEEHHAREDLDGGAGQPGEQPAGDHGDRGLHEEGEAHADPHEQAAGSGSTSPAWR